MAAMLKWSTISTTSPAVTNPNVQVLVKTEDRTIIPFVGTHPDDQVNVFAYDATNDKYTIESLVSDPNFPSQQGPVHDGQYCLTGIKYEWKICKSRTNYLGHNTSHGLVPKEGEEVVPVCTYKKQTFCQYIIWSGMWDAFNIPNPCNAYQT